MTVAERYPMLRYEMSLTELEILIFLAKGKRKSSEVATLLSVADRSAGVYLYRLRQRGYIASARGGVNASHWLEEKGQRVIDEIRGKIG